MSEYKREPLPLADGVEFIKMLEKAVADGSPDLVSANMPKLIRYVKMYQDRIYQLSQIQFRARSIIDQHEPTAEDRKPLTPGPSTHVHAESNSLSVEAGGQKNGLFNGLLVREENEAHWL